MQTAEGNVVFHGGRRHDRSSQAMPGHHTRDTTLLAASMQGIMKTNNDSTISLRCSALPAAAACGGGQ